MAIALTTRQAVLTRAVNRLTANLQKCEDLEKMVLEPPLDEDSRRVYVASKRRELCKWKTVLESEVSNVSRALENYSSTADDLDPQTPSLPEILQKVNANVETTAQHMDTAYSAITTIEMLLEELDSVTKEHKDAVPNRSPDKQLLGKFTEDVQRQVLRKKEQDSPERSWDTATLLSAAKNYIAMELKVVSRTNKKREHHLSEAQSFKEKMSSSRESKRTTDWRNCFYCGRQDHVPRDCDFVRTREARLDIIRKKKLCHNCGAKDHLVSQCPKGPCRLCKQHGHHTSVCRQLFSAPTKPSAAQDVKTVPQPQTQGKTTPKRSKTSISTKVNTTLTEQGQVQDVVPNTAVYVNHHRNGTNVHILVGQAQVLNPRNQALEVVHVMLDTGADRSFISTQLADHLELRDIKSVELSISTFGSQQPLKRTCGVTELQMWDAQGKAHKVTVTKIDTVTEPILRSNLSHEDKQFLCDHNMSLSINSNVTDLHPQVLLGCADLYSFLDKGLTAETSLPSGLKL
ncbi:Zinc knuckle, partial [Trichostrongylus colubriformis]